MPQDLDFLACKVFMMFMREEFNYAKLKWAKIEKETERKNPQAYDGDVYNFGSLAVGDVREYGNVNERRLRQTATMWRIRKQVFLRVKTLSHGKYLVSRIEPV